MTRKNSAHLPDRYNFYCVLLSMVRWIDKCREQVVASALQKKKKCSSLCSNILLVFLYVLIVRVFVCTRMWGGAHLCVHIWRSAVHFGCLSLSSSNCWDMVSYSLKCDAKCICRSVPWSLLEEPEDSSIKRGCICIHCPRYPTGSLLRLTQHPQGRWEQMRT